jgi:uncharacterized membrane protein YfcA
MLDLVSMAAIGTAFLLAGTVKGVIGLGLPTVSLGLLTVALDLPTAMALLVVPSFVTNLWQATSGGNGAAILLRIWPFLLMATTTVWLGATALTRLDPALLTALLGALMICYAALNLAGVRLSIPARVEVWAGPLCGAANGILTGMTGSFVVPGVMFLQAIGLARDMLVQAMGMLFTVSTAALALALQRNNFLTAQLGLVSAAALLPALAGMIVGQRVRRRLSEARFRQVLFSAILALGAYIVAHAAVEIS